MAETDTAKWFKDIQIAAERKRKRFEKFVQSVRGVAVLLNKFNLLHEETLRQHEKNNVDIASEPEKRQ